VSKYPPRLSTAELREELAAYLAERAQQIQRRSGQPTSAAALDLDKRKVAYFLHWLDTGELPGEG
jgi:hypothetical protein